MTIQKLKQDFETARIRRARFRSTLRSWPVGNGGATAPAIADDTMALLQTVEAQLRTEAETARHRASAA